jgi:hypothetical protein
MWLQTTPFVIVSDFSFLSLYICSPRLFVYISVYLCVHAVFFYLHFFISFPRSLSSLSLTPEQIVLHILFSFILVI